VHPKLLLKVLTPTRVILEQPDVSAFACRMKGTGVLEIMPGHLPLMGATQSGTVEYLVNEEFHELKLDEGILQVDGETINVLVIEAGFDPPKIGSATYGRLKDELFKQLKATAKENEVAC
jgi:F0F1-type ATP synthase epsilon subunit